MLTCSWLLADGCLLQSIGTIPFGRATVIKFAVGVQESCRTSTSRLFGRALGDCMADLETVVFNMYICQRHLGLLAPLLCSAHNTTAAVPITEDVGSIALSCSKMVWHDAPYSINRASEQGPSAAADHIAVLFMSRQKK